MNMTTVAKARAMLDAMRYLPGPLEAVEDTRADPAAVAAWCLRSVPMDCAIADDLDARTAEALVDLHNFAADVAMAYLSLVERLGELTAIAGIDERRPTATRRQRRATQPPPVAPAPTGGGGGGPGATVYLVAGTPQVTPAGMRKLASAGVTLPAVSTDTPPPTSTPFVVSAGINDRPSIATVAEVATTPAPIVDTPIPGRADPFEVAGRKLGAVAGVLASVRDQLAAMMSQATEVDGDGKLVIDAASRGAFVALQRVRDQLAAALEVHPNPDPREPVPAQSTA